MAFNIRKRKEETEEEDLQRSDELPPIDALRDRKNPKPEPEPLTAEDLLEATYYLIEKTNEHLVTQNKILEDVREAVILLYNNSQAPKATIKDQESIEGDAP